MSSKIQMLFPEGKKKTLTLSYDDGTIHDRRLVEIMNHYEIRGTFNLNSGIFSRKEITVMDGIEVNTSTISEEEVKSLYQGHEVASHTVNHPSLTELSAALSACEVLEDRKRLEELWEGLVRGFAYPFGSYSKEAEAVLEMCGIEYARTVVSTGQFHLPESFLEWHPTCHHDAPQLMELVRQFCESTPWSASVFYLWGHSYEFSQRDNWNVIEAFFQYVSEFKDDIWMATNLEIVDYVKAYRRLCWSADGKMVYNPSAMDLWFSHENENVCIKTGKIQLSCRRYLDYDFVT